jgi:imidazolonepropionase-like amidohydrolase
MKRVCLGCLLLLFASAALSAQTSTEHGRYILHKFARTNGEETYSIQHEGGKLTLKSDFLFTDRGDKVPLKTTFTAGEALEPLSLTLDGQSSRWAQLKDSMEYHPQTQRITLVRAGKTEEVAAPAGTFLVDGYSPVAMQQMLLRYWLSHDKPVSIPTPPAGSVSITPAGMLAVTVAGKETKLEGYVITGLIWGGEMLWMDEHQNLAALVSTDAEFDHFEAVREEYEPALATFIQTAAKENLAALAKLAASAKQPVAKRLAIQNVTLIDGTGALPLKGATVFIESGVIKQIAHADHIDPQQYTVIDGTGKFLIPGLWDMHAHYEQVEWGPIYLAAGVTTARDCGNEFDFITTVRDTVASGKGIGPEILVAGIVDSSGPMSVGAVIADTPEQAVEIVRKYKAAGALQIKIYSSLKPKLVPVITAEAHKLGMTVTGHVPNGMTTTQAVEAGYDQINHIQYPTRDLLHIERGKPIPPLDFTTDDAKKQIALFKQHHTVFDDTVSLYENFSHPASVPYATLEPGVLKVAPQLAEALSSPGASGEREKASLAAMMATVRELHKDGLTLVAGTDQNIPGYSLHRELELYVEAGFTPMEALQAATSVPAKVMGLDKIVGTIERGKRADLVLLDADPLADIHNTRRIAKTISAGAVYDPAPLWESVGFKP